MKKGMIIIFSILLTIVLVSCSEKDSFVQEEEEIEVELSNEELTKDNVTGIPSKEVNSIAYGEEIEWELYQHENAQKKQIYIQIKTDNIIKPIHDLQFGINVPSISGAQASVHRNALQELGDMSIRYPGGLVNDLFDWRSDVTHTDGSNLPVPTPWNEFVNLIKEAGISFEKVQIGVNYGTLPMSVAVDWVKDANINRKLGIKYWEIGNEQWYSEEPDLHGSTLRDGTELPGKPHDPETYGRESAKFMKAMKEIDPTIKVGVHVDKVPYSTEVYKAMKEEGEVPDYIIYHCYPMGGMATDIASLTHSKGYLKQLIEGLRGELTTEFGDAGKEIEILLNEYNSTYMTGKQTSSIVNALYMADVVANSFYQDVQNITWFTYKHVMSTITFTGNNNNLYGWRKANNGIGFKAWYGDMQMIQTEKNDKYPVFYIAKLLNRFLEDGDLLLELTDNNDVFLNSYAVKALDGSVKLLVLNKSADTEYQSTIDFDGTSFQGEATCYSYGMENDDAAGTGEGNPDITKFTKNISSNQFEHAFQPYSATVFILSKQDIDITAPDVVEKISVGKITYESVELSWDAVEDAHHYDIYYRPNNFNNTYWTLADSVNDTKALIKGLNHGIDYTLMIKAVDQAGNSSEKSNSIKIQTQLLIQSIPYNETAHKLPGTIDAVEYDRGGEGLAYSDQESANLGAEFRMTEGIDMQTCALGGYNIGWIKKGEWMNYTAEISEPAKYNIAFQVACAGKGGTFHLELEGKNISGPLTIPNSGDWQNWVLVEAKNIELQDGIHTFKMCFDDQDIMVGYTGNFKSMTFTKID